jgi:hypothetical protein
VKRTILRIEVIPHNEQKYNTIGDYWWEPGGELVIVVSDLGDPLAEMLVGLHEAIEGVALHYERPLTDDPNAIIKAVNDFDIAFEDRRLRSTDNHPEFTCLANHLHAPDDEPGDCSAAPYHREHSLATAVERMLCAFVGYPWQKYEDVCAQPTMHEEKYVTTPTA